MASEGSTAKQILHVRIRMPSADMTSLLTATMKNALSVFSAFGDAQVRLLRNADDRTQFLQMIEYQMDQAIELNRQKFASDPMVQNYLQAWRTLFPGTIEIDVYEDITESP